MPMIRVQLSCQLEGPALSGLMKQLSSTVAGALGKPESYMMVVVDQQIPILMAADDAPAALVEVRSVGSISDQQARDISARVSGLLGESAGIGPDRVYANFMGVPGAMWGYNGGTFG